MSTYLVTGSGRGLGLAIVQELAGYPADKLSKVVASSRSGPSEELQKVLDASDRVIWVQLDIADPESAKKAAAETERLLGDAGLDYLINSGGVIKWQAPEVGIAEMDDLHYQFNVNVGGTQNVISSLIPLLQKGKQKKIGILSTAVASIGLSTHYNVFNTPSYKISKAALNMLAAQYAEYYKKDNFTVLSISPGWCRTDLGGPDADLSAQEGANAVLMIMHERGPDSTGKFLNIHVAGWENNPGLNQYNGAEIPW